MAPLTDSLPEFFPEVPLATQLNETKKMSNHYIWNCFASQKLQLFSKAMKPKAIFVHFQVKFNNMLIRNQRGRSFQN